MASGEVALTLEQLCVVKAFERTLQHLHSEVDGLEAIRQGEAVEKLKAMFRHLDKLRTEYIADCQRAIIIPKPVIQGVTP